MPAARGSGYHNRQFGADLFWRPTQSDAFRVQYIRTDTQYPDAIVDGLRPAEGRVRRQRHVRSTTSTSREKWVAFASYEAYDSGFRADTGFVPRVDVRTSLGQAQRRWFRGAGAWFNTIDIGMRGWRTTDDDWTLSEDTVAAFVNYTGPYQTQAQFNMPRDVVVYEGVRYEYYRPNVYFGIKPSGRSALSVQGRFGDGVDYANNRKAHGVVQLAPAIEYRPGVAREPAAELQPRPARRSTAAASTRPTSAQLKAIYHINVRTFVRAILQYTDITRDPDLYLYPVEPRTRRFFSQYPLLVQAQPPDRDLRGLLGQRRRAAGQRPAAAEPHVLPEARVRVGVLKNRR